VSGSAVAIPLRPQCVPPHLSARPSLFPTGFQERTQSLWSRVPCAASSGGACLAETPTLQMQGTRFVSPPASDPAARTRVIAVTQRPPLCAQAELALGASDSAGTSQAVEGQPGLTPGKGACLAWPLRPWTQRRSSSRLRQNPFSGCRNMDKAPSSSGAYHGALLSAGWGGVFLGGSSGGDSMRRVSTAPCRCCEPQVPGTSGTALAFPGLHPAGTSRAYPRVLPAAGPRREAAARGREASSSRQGPRAELFVSVGRLQWGAYGAPVLR